MLRARSQTAVSRHLRAARYLPTGFRFRYRKVWGLKSLRRAMWLPPSGAVMTEEDFGLRFALRAQLSAQVPPYNVVGQSGRVSSGYQLARQIRHCWMMSPVHEVATPQCSEPPNALSSPKATSVPCSS